MEKCQRLNKKTQCFEFDGLVENTVSAAVVVVITAPWVSVGGRGGGGQFPVTYFPPASATPCLQQSMLGAVEGSTAWEWV